MKKNVVTRPPENSVIYLDGFQAWRLKESALLAERELQSQTQFININTKY